VAPRQPSAERAEAAAYTEVANRLLALEEKDQHWDQQVNDLTQRICVQDDAIESLKKRLAVLEGKPSRSSDAERTTISHRWAWREVSQIGEEFFDLLEKPFTKSVSVEFVKNAEE
jgi:predicted RNase H-like nuclease (RuvC/YqgF family)